MPDVVVDQRVRPCSGGGVQPKRDRPSGAQLRYPCEGREYYDRKRAEGKNTKEAIRALKRQISNVVYRTLVADSRRLEQ
ncbi:MAG TPA: hypothetical protein VLN74_14015 [Ilumatobacteraceae bacterium]|nr:hypothetical protein [Ilumatobacteraceae bacterium]